MTKLHRLRAYPPFTTSLQAQEGLAVLQRGDQLDIGAITWLLSTSSNSTVQDISFLAVVGLPPKDTDLTTLLDVAASYNWHTPVDGLEYRIRNAAACIPGLRPESHLSIFCDPDASEEGDGRQLFNSLIIPALSLRGPSRLTLLDFLPTSPRGHVRLPFAVWRLCIGKFRECSLDPVALTQLLRKGIFEEQNAVTTGSPGTLVEALRGNLFLRTLLLRNWTFSQMMRHRLRPSLSSVPLCFGPYRS